MKTVKLIALDLDGTLVPEDQRVSLKDRAAIWRAQAAGIPVVIATGRMHCSTRAFLAALRIHTPAICCNGADIREDAKSVYKCPIDPGQLQSAYRAMEGYNAKRYVYCEDHIYCTKADFDKVLFHKWGKKEVDGGLVVYLGGPDEIFRAAGASAIKFTVRTPDESRHPEIREKAAAFDYFDVVKGELRHFEFTRRGTNKGEALKRIARGMGIAMRDVLAVGDSMNDLEMLRAAGIGIAMGNAMGEVLKIADGVTLPVWESGVAHAIARHVFGEA